MSCHSAEMARRLIKLAPVVITVRGVGDDEECIQFISRFYRCLLQGSGVDWAYNIAHRANRDLETLMLRRAELDTESGVLIRARLPGGATVYVDASATERDLVRLGLNEAELHGAIAHKIRFHGWIFRYPRNNVLIPIGEVVGRFSWEDAEDRVFCESVYRIKPDCPDSICSTWLEMLIKYHELYIADYRSPNWRDSRRAEEKVFNGLQRLQSFRERHMASGGDFFLVRDYVDRDLKASYAMFIASMNVAEDRYKSRDLSGCIQHMEAALSSLHDALESMGKSVLI